jgi:hypothetical protein
MPCRPDRSTCTCNPTPLPSGPRPPSPARPPALPPARPVQVATGRETWNATYGRMANLHAGGAAPGGTAAPGRGGDEDDDEGGWVSAGRRLCVSDPRAWRTGFRHGESMRGRPCVEPLLNNLLSVCVYDCLLLLLLPPHTQACRSSTSVRTTHCRWVSRGAGRVGHATPELHLSGNVLELLLWATTHAERSGPVHPRAACAPALWRRRRAGL